MTDTKNYKVTLIETQAIDNTVPMDNALTRFDEGLGEHRIVDLTSESDPLVLDDTQAFATAFLDFIGTPGSSHTVEFPTGTGRSWTVRNSMTDGSDLIMKVAGSSVTITLGPGSVLVVASDETDLLTAESRAYDISSYYNGVPANGEFIFRMRCARRIAFPAAFAGSKGVAGTTATANANFDIQRNGVKIGTLQFGTGAVSPNFSDDLGGVVAFAEDDVLAIKGPATADATLADFGFTLAGLRG